MPLRFLGKETIDGGSPTLYDHGDTWVIQGYIVLNMAALAHFELEDGEALVEVHKTLMDHLPDGVRLRPGCHMLFDTGTMYVLKGPKVTDPAVLAQLHLPDHETVIEVPKDDLTEAVDGVDRRTAHV
ncbi:hypothetical protein EDD29_6442 [Actinocorallia herbida]|uniref:Uncharacterized protein n=1 Tax=Actinocorallia herbida TaxID=58109 RepID=A0A3N1D5E1_9ACTN|nr:hypothetical protein [Actinocorallia herbida]ROO88763.1 hypothetical protein EDD29_6442 [Actinocorallia herbida]